MSFIYKESDLSQEEIDGLAVKLIDFQKKSEMPGVSAEFKQQYKDFQNYCIIKLKFLIAQRASKYKKFSNYLDLEQDGFEALLLALKTYDPKKGSFSWWADKYISTKIARSASAHSTIRIPIKRSKEIKPHKTDILPIMLDNTKNPELNCQHYEAARLITNGIDRLSREQQTIINYYYGFNNYKISTLDAISEKMQISKTQASKLLHQAEKKIKKYLICEEL